MDELNQNAIGEVENTLQHLLLGKPCAPISLDAEGLLPEVAHQIELVNMLSSNLNELNEFARQLAKGNLDVQLPGRRNYLAGTLKELHAQLSSFVWSVHQLQKGSVVERMDYRGEISDALNSLIARMVELSAGKISMADAGNPVNSWQFHQLHMAFNHLPIMVLEVEHNGHVTYANKRAMELFGETAYLVTEQAPEELHGLVSYLSDPNIFEGDQYPIVHELYNKDNDRWYKITTDSIAYPDGRELLLHSLEDISEWKSSEQKLHHSATVDFLTGVYNRSVGMDALHDVLHDAEAGTSAQHCVAFIDIDGLKAINDTYGHAEGDYTITSIAQVLANTVRTSDTISRVGGDEFLIVFRDCVQHKAEQVISRMLDRVEEINRNHEKPFRLSFSHGIVQVSADSDISVSEIVMLADKKMYERKTAKKKKDMLEHKAAASE